MKLLDGEAKLDIEFDAGIVKKRLEPLPGNFVGDENLHERSLVPDRRRSVRPTPFHGF
jgi:hypothetical protein